MRLFLRDIGENTDKEVTVEELRERIDSFTYEDDGYFDCSLVEVSNSGDLYFEIAHFGIYG